MYRALATANAFVEHGWDVTVLAPTRDTFEVLTGTDPGAEARIDARVSVVRVPFALDRGFTDLSQWTRTRATLPLWWSLWRSLRDRWRFPEVWYGHWYSALVAAAEQVNKVKPVSLVIGTSNPQVDFAPGAHLHRTHQVPYVMDYRDAWHLDVYTGRTIGAPWDRSTRLERRWLHNAAEAWFVNEPIRDWHRTRYPHRADTFHVVANGFDSSFLNAKRTRVRDTTNGVTFGFLGSIYGQLPLRLSLEGWRLAREMSSLVARSQLIIRGNLGHFAVPEPSTVATIADFADNGVRYGGPVSKTQVGEVYNEFDALLFAVSSSKFITSGKVFEYVATGLPIVSVHEADSAASTVLNGYPAWHASNGLNTRDIASAFIATAEDAARQTADDRVRAQRWAERYSRNLQLEPRIAALTELVQ
jgi:glycosyltransferase involved in cell wall biosynthesis